jgi:hypothetical protein
LKERGVRNRFVRDVGRWRECGLDVAKSNDDSQFRSDLGIHGRAF